MWLSQYLPGSIHLLFCGLQHIMRRNHWPWSVRHFWQERRTYHLLGVLLMSIYTSRIMTSENLHSSNMFTLDLFRMTLQSFRCMYFCAVYNIQFLVYLQENVFLVKISFDSNHSCHGSLWYMNVPWLQRHRLGYINIVYVLCGGFYWYTHPSWY